MIEKIKQIAVVCHKQDKEASLEVLRSLGVLHVVQNKTPQSEELSDVRGKIEKLQEIINFLKPHQDGDGKERSFPEYDDKETIDLLKEAWKAKHDITWYEENIANHDRMYAQLEPWGEFDGSLIKTLQEKGLDIRLCACKSDEIPELPESATVKVINEANGKVYFIVISTEKLEVELPEVQVHLETSLSELADRNAQSEQVIATLRGKLQIYANYMERYTDAMTMLVNKQEFVENRDGMGADKDLVYINGYIPAKDAEKVRQSARANGMAVMMTDADLDDAEVPVALNPPKLFNVSKPIFKFLGIMPGYDENDVSIPVLLFLTLFFGMIVGDAGYGLIFLVVSLFAKLKCKADPKKAVVANLFILLSVTTVLWGMFTGNYFAIKFSEDAPAFFKGVQFWQWLPEAMTAPVEAITDAAEKATQIDLLRNKAIQWFCFFLAGFHLALGRGWKALVSSAMGKKVQALGHIGWALFIWGNFFVATTMIIGTVFPTAAWYLFGIGAVLIMLCGVNWTDIGDVLNLPFSFIGSFVDVLSYIRLFAVGLASFYIASSFNNMGGMVYDLSPWLLPFTILIILFGHILNIALGFMGVLVHGVRLNTLEFSNHMELTWKGRFYKPFKKINK